MLLNSVALCPGGVREGQVFACGPLCKDGFLCDEAVPPPGCFLVGSVHLALIQPPVLIVMVRHCVVIGSAREETHINEIRRYC